MVQHDHLQDIFLAVNHSQCQNVEGGTLDKLQDIVNNQSYHAKCLVFPILGCHRAVTPVYVPCDIAHTKVIACVLSNGIQETTEQTAYLTLAESELCPSGPWILRNNKCFMLRRSCSSINDEQVHYSKSADYFLSKNSHDICLETSLAHKQNYRPTYTDTHVLNADIIWVLKNYVGYVKYMNVLIPGYLLTFDMPNPYVPSFFPVSV